MYINNFHNLFFPANREKWKLNEIKTNEEKLQSDYQFVYVFGCVYRKQRERMQTWNKKKCMVEDEEEGKQKKFAVIKRMSLTKEKLW